MRRVGVELSPRSESVGLDRVGIERGTVVGRVAIDHRPLLARRARLVANSRIFNVRVGDRLLSWMRSALSTCVRTGKISTRTT